MSVFECSICLDSVQDPVVTLCGHLFCRPCLDEWLQLHSHRRECPVCKARVDQDKLVPIYGNPGIPSQQPETAPVPPELPPELTYVRQDRSRAPRGLTCNPLFCAISSSVWNSLVKAISSVWSLLFGVVSSVWNTLVAVLAFVWSLLFSAVSSVWNLLFSVVSSIWNILVYVISSVWNCLLDAIPFVWNALAETECLWTRPHAERNKLAFLTICFIGFLVLYIRVSSWFS